jgi:hypothetical protein
LLSRKELTYFSLDELAASYKKNDSLLSVDNIVAELNLKYHHVNGKKLCKSTLYRAVRHVKASESPMKRGPAPKIPVVLIDSTSVNQEMDALYGAFKSATYARGEVILTEQMRLRGLKRSAAAMAAAAAAAVNDDDDKVNATEDVNAGAPPLTSFTMGFEDLSTCHCGWEQHQRCFLEAIHKDLHTRVDSWIMVEGGILSLHQKLRPEQEGAS